MPALLYPEIAKNRTNTRFWLKKPILQLGSVGTDVLELQKLLTRRGVYTGPIGGYFDMSVRDAAIAFQHRVFLKEDGIVGALTWEALDKGAPVNMPILRYGSKDGAVITLQWVLQRTGDYQVSIDGDFGDRTEAAVKSFQESHGLVVDGIVGEETWNALSLAHDRVHSRERLPLSG
ncbi:MAG TPA: peptidoglycan-binding protein [Cyanobacteria bacterium UBA11149]|nr:peptidoglycan-binding protein [Cyanobacteria bacterium UBA11367]HBE60106.1 peptidoglycan-binding protein [Cyanobacteria bacterium UBA11366]HBK62682.1 peptidoglycan-binding protein [Cyanobacteria bacterium UBA11166]HBR73209.1 peptidoglycan-binding protein [Cyanobacteria bacterium UBA11159]HBS71636.1 peptidoglycan-binding protein [Cyanobacteria bacterium UBA11153]HBW90812.1 peptidoglycan-binding protein [Cyanobacteria bacterium UBA11149]HCA97721.1 peptidoglycan-binding protein [Cyanobacteria